MSYNVKGKDGEKGKQGQKEDHGGVWDREIEEALAIAAAHAIIWRPIWLPIINFKPLIKWKLLPKPMTKKQMYIAAIQINKLLNFILPRGGSSNRPHSKNPNCYSPVKTQKALIRSILGIE